MTQFYKRLPSEIGTVGRDFEFDLEALAQHYEFKTNDLDITKNFNVAMFFAYTDCINGKYVPINFNNTDYEPHIYVANLGILQSMERNNLKIVGFQVSPRPLAQKAMALDLNNFENEVTSYFTKISLPKNEYFSVGIFNAFKKGFELIQPDILTEAVNQIKSSKTDILEYKDILVKRAIEAKSEMNPEQRAERRKFLDELMDKFCRGQIELEE